MHISHLKIRNFKSIASADIEFNRLTMLVGANASGKSNLINVFRFISNIATEGIDNAIALQGGITYLANASLPRGTPIEIGFTLDLSNEGWIRFLGEKDSPMEIQSVDYLFIIQPNLRGGGYHIAKDRIILSFDLLDTIITENGKKKYKSKKIRYQITAEKRTSKSRIQLKREFSPPSNDNSMSSILEGDYTTKVFVKICNEDKNELILYRMSMLLPPRFSENSFIRIYDFDPKALKKSSTMASMTNLDEDGSNIASVLNNILRSKDNRKKLTILLNDFLPFIDGISIESNFDKSFSYMLHERYSNRGFYASYLSDGTVSLLAIIIALYFEDLSNIIILEEPERNIHPKLLANLLTAAEEVSSEKQIIITTHNPVFLKYIHIDNVRLMQRDKEGFTLVSEPKNSEAVNCFLENDLGLDDLFLQDMLGE